MDGLRSWVHHGALLFVDLTCKCAATQARWCELVHAMQSRGLHLRAKSQKSKLPWILRNPLGMGRGILIAL